MELEKSFAGIGYVRGSSGSRVLSGDSHISKKYRSAGHTMCHRASLSREVESQLDMLIRIVRFLLRKYVSLSLSLSLSLNIFIQIKCDRYKRIKFSKYRKYYNSVFIDVIRKYLNNLLNESDE